MGSGEYGKEAFIIGCEGKLMGFLHLAVETAATQTKPALSRLQNPCFSVSPCQADLECNSPSNSIGEGLAQDVNLNANNLSGNG